MTNLPTKEELEKLLSVMKNLGGFPITLRTGPNRHQRRTKKANSKKRGRGYTKPFRRSKRKRR